jgi:hypothetical protein
MKQSTQMTLYDICIQLSMVIVINWLTTPSGMRLTARERTTAQYLSS